MMCDCDARLTELESRLAKLEGKKTVEPGEFEQFWSAYPKKVGKLAAQKAFRNAQSRPRINDLLDALARACKSEQWRKDGGQFIPLATTWLNQGRWDDEPVQVMPVQPMAQVKIAPRQLSERQAYSPPPPEVMALLTRIGRGM
jgi:hypothetical protein